MNATTKSILPATKVNSKITTAGGIIHCQWDEEVPITLQDTYRISVSSCMQEVYLNGWLRIVHWNTKATMLSL